MVVEELVELFLLEVCFVLVVETNGFSVVNAIVLLGQELLEGEEGGASLTRVAH